MKTHEHALISIAYGAILGAAAGHSLLDPGIYAAAFIGGELIDFIDHPIYQIRSINKDPVVKGIWRKLKQEGVWEFLKELGQKEEERKFNRLLLHNVLALTILSLIAIIISLWLPGPVYSFILLGAFLLHMFTDMLGDFEKLGHFDNWLWILPERLIQWTGKLGYKLIWLVLFWWGIILSGFILVGMRIIWQLRQPLQAQSNLLALLATSDASALKTALAYGPLFLLLVYFSFTFVLIIAGSHKLNLESGPSQPVHRRRFTTGSLSILWKFITNRLDRKQNSWEQLLLSIQGDQAVWILILTLIVAAILIIEGLFFNVHLPATLILLMSTPVVMALVFGTLVHTTIGEYTGVQSVLLATFLNLILFRYSTTYRWPADYGLLLFSGAVLAWILGLFGGIFLRENKSLSLITFVVRLHGSSSLPSSEFFRSSKAAAFQSLNKGYRDAYNLLYGAGSSAHNRNAQSDCFRAEAVEPATQFLITSASGSPALSGEYCHLTISDKIVPILQELYYVLCSNRLTSLAPYQGAFGMLPILPRTRKIISDPRQADMVWENGSYQWSRNEQMITMPSCENVRSWLPEQPGERHRYLGLTKTWGEMFDNLVTIKVAYNTDLYLYPSPQDPCEMILCGITRAKTSTKAYATVEAETYASQVMKWLERIAGEDPTLHISEHQLARIVYPHVAFDDRETSGEIARSAFYQAINNPCYSHEAAALLVKTLDLIPGANKNIDAVSDLRRRITLLIGQLGISISSIFAFVTNDYRAIKEMIEGLLRTLGIYK